MTSFKSVSLWLLSSVRAGRMESLYSALQPSNLVDSVIFADWQNESELLPVREYDSHCERLTSCRPDPLHSKCVQMLDKMSRKKKLVIPKPEKGNSQVSKKVGTHTWVVSGSWSYRDPRREGWRFMFIQVCHWLQILSIGTEYREPPCL